MTLTLTLPPKHTLFSLHSLSYSSIYASLLSSSLQISPSPHFLHPSASYCKEAAPSIHPPPLPSPPSSLRVAEQSPPWLLRSLWRPAQHYYFQDNKEGLAGVLLYALSKTPISAHAPTHTIWKYAQYDVCRWCVQDYNTSCIYFGLRKQVIAYKSIDYGKGFD